MKEKEIIDFIKSHSDIQKELVNYAIDIANGVKRTDSHYFELKRKWQESRLKLNAIKL